MRVDCRRSQLPSREFRFNFIDTMERLVNFEESFKKDQGCASRRGFWKIMPLRRLRKESARLMTTSYVKKRH